MSALAPVAPLSKGEHAGEFGEDERALTVNERTGVRKLASAPRQLGVLIAPMPLAKNFTYYILRGSAVKARIACFYKTG
jgi:hypothetical protein